MLGIRETDCADRPNVAFGNFKRGLTKSMISVILNMMNMINILDHFLINNIILLVNLFIL